jgi:NAD(P)-dependent dehydrogenase (short-subunit alcohol dehydrogenase family)
VARARYPIAGKRILVTGAARGIGAGVAGELADRGARVALVGLEPALLADVAAGCGPDAVWFEADVTDSDAISAAVGEAAEHLGGLDVVIANAGVAALGTVLTIDPAAFERVIAVNLLGVWRTVRAALPHLIRSRGYVLPVASVAAAAHSPAMAAYSASKAGVEAFADSLRQEVAARGVGVGVAYFSWIATDMVAGADGHPVFGRFRARLKGAAGRTYPLSSAVDAVVRGIERRSRTVVAPGWVRGVLVLRGVLQPLSELFGRRVAAEMVQETEADVERRGAAEAALPAGRARAGIGG